MKYRKLLEWIENNLNTRITVSELASIAGYSERYLRILFKRHTGMSPSEYITKRKLTQAAFMLRETSRPITDISLMFGFEYQTAFSRSFKKFTGKSPREYRFSEMRDMNHFCPSKTLKDVPCFVTYTHMKDVKIKVLRKKTLHLDFGLDFLIFKSNDYLLPRQDISNMILDFIFKDNNLPEIMILGELYPGHNCDTILNIYAGVVVDSESIEYDIVSIDEGDFICFTFSGTPDELMACQIWARGHGLHKHGVTLRNSSALTSFQSGSEPGVYTCHYYFPCYLLRHT